MLGEHTSAASAYVAMTRGRDHNVAHLVADDDDDARRQWEQVFGRDRADLGPAAAAEQAAEDIERYGTQQPTRPLEEVLGDLWAAWTRQADLHEQHQRLADERDALQQVAAIQARYTPERDRSAATRTTPGAAGSQARQRVDDLDAALRSETADLQTRVWDAWRQELPQAQRAAEIVREGAGRLGQHRRQVRDASAELTAFAAALAPRPARPAHRPCGARRPGDVAARAPRRRPDQRASSLAGRRRPPGRRPDPRDRARRLHGLRARRTGAHPARRGHVRRAAPLRAGSAHARPGGPTHRRHRPNWQASNATCAPPQHASRPSRTNRASGASRTADSTANDDRWAADRHARQQAAAREAKERWQAPAERETADRADPTEPEHSRPRVGHRPLKRLTDQRPQAMSDPVRKLLPFTSWTTAQPAQLGGRR